MAKSSSFGQLAGLLVVSVLVLATTGLFGVWSAHQQSEKALAEADHLTALTDTARAAQVDFKTEVQLWKNTLLRGQNQQQFDSYKERLQKQQTMVQADLDQMAKAPGLPSDIVSEIQAMQAALTTVGEAYMRGVADYVVGDPSSIFRVDASVKGVDQALNERFTELAEKLAAHRQQELVQVRVRAEQQYATLRTVTAIVGAIASLIAIVVAWRAVRTTA